MGRLHIKCLERQPDGDYALRFSGHRPDFLAMIEDLKYERCRWDPDACRDGKGGWIVDYHTLMDFSERFDNIWQLIHQEEEREQRRQTYTGGKPVEPNKVNNIYQTPF